MHVYCLQGDLGGPLTFEGVQVGLMSFGGSDLGCEPGLEILFLYVLTLPKCFIMWQESLAPSQGYLTTEIGLE